MTDLVVKLQELEDSQAALQKNITKFEHASDRVKANAEVYSDGHVADAMNSFASNWKDHREKLLKKMDDAYQHSQKCLESWQQVDGSLAGSLSTHQSGGSGHSRAE